MHILRKSKLALAGLLGLGTALTLLAQSDTPPVPASAEDNSPQILQQVVVTGIRRGIEREDGEPFEVFADVLREGAEVAAGEPIDGARQGLLDQLFQGIRGDRLESIVSGKIGAFITACRLRERDNFMSGRTNRYRYELTPEGFAAGRLTEQA